MGESVRFVNDTEIEILIAQGYGYSHPMGGFAGLRSDGLIMHVRGYDLFVDPWSAIALQLFKEQLAESKELAELYLQEM